MQQNAGAGKSNALLWSLLQDLRSLQQAVLRLPRLTSRSVATPAVRGPHSEAQKPPSVGKRTSG